MIGYLEEELKRLVRMNDLLEKKFETCISIKNEPEQIADNIDAICKIAFTIHYLS